MLLFLAEYLAQFESGFQVSQLCIAPQGLHGGTLGTVRGPPLTPNRRGRCVDRTQEGIGKGASRLEALGRRRLQAFLEESGIDPQAKSGLGQFLVLAAIVVVAIFILSRFIR